MVRKFNTGATRDTDQGKLDPQGFTSPFVFEAIDDYTVRQRDIAWAAGLFEGEGSIVLKKQANKVDGSPQRHPSLSLAITDEDVLQRFVYIVGEGKCVPEKKIRDGANRLRYGWSVQGKKAYRVISMLLPYFGARRTAKFIDVFGDNIVTERWNLPVLSIQRYSEYLHKHRVQADGELRDSDNWKRGIPHDVYAKSLWRHMLDVMKAHEGDKTVDMEESLCAVLFNAQGYLHELIKERRGIHSTSVGVRPDVCPDTVAGDAPGTIARWSRWMWDWAWGKK